MIVVDTTKLDDRIGVSGETKTTNGRRTMTTAQRIELDNKASKIARDIKSNEIANLNCGIWKTEAARKRNDRLTAQLEKLDEKLDAE